ncbi:DUF1980 domain-containing protein, partial [Bacillus haynesii]|uniref:DUF1980 domain-containing protein n=1 Tax=Bacillus haynesii TaxID=1925021 RepID=UPI002DDD51C6
MFVSKLSVCCKKEVLPMIFQPRQFLRALVLAAFSVFIFKLHYTGEIDKLINPKYDYT